MKKEFYEFIFALRSSGFKHHTPEAMSTLEYRSEEIFHGFTDALSIG